MRKNATRRQAQDKLGRGRLNELMAKPLAMARELNLPLYCGEWGAYGRAPRQAELAWYRDMISIFDEHNIAQANWTYQSVKSDGDLANLMVGERSSPAPHARFRLPSLECPAYP